jgi:hypothetical protein
MNDSSKHAAQNPFEIYANNLDVRMYFELKLQCQEYNIFSTHGAANDDGALYRWRYYTVANLITSKLSMLD